MFAYRWPFDLSVQTTRELDGHSVAQINSDLTSAVDVTTAKHLPENVGLAFMGDTKVGPFELSAPLAAEMLGAVGNPNGRPNSDVVRPWANGLDVTRRSRDMWIIDFGTSLSEVEAALYEAPFEYLSERVRPFRAIAKSGDRTGVVWWRHQRPRPDMRAAIAKLTSYLATARVSKHRLFVRLSSSVLPDCQLIAIAREDDYFLGVLHSKVHELWALRLGTALEDRPRYTPTTTFETFPFPFPTRQRAQRRARRAHRRRRARPRL